MKSLMRGSVALLVCWVAGFAQASPSDLREVDALWARRDDPQVASRIEPLLRDALKANSNDFELLWRAARERAWVADNALDNRLKRQAGKEAWNFGEQAKKLRPERVEGYYYSGVGIGAHAVGVGIFKAMTLGLEKEFLSNMERAAQLDPTVDRGGPLLALGRYYDTIPWPKQDRAKSEAYYRAVLKRFPENLRARHYLAQLKLKENDKEQARALAAQVRTAPVDYDPAEGRRVQAWAARTEQLLPSN